MIEHSVQVVISDAGGRQVRVSWRGNARQAPLVLQVASVSTPAPLDRLPAAAERPSSAPAALSLELRWSEPPPPERAAPASEAPLATAWAVERLRQRHLDTSGVPARPRATRAAGR